MTDVNHWAPADLPMNSHRANTIQEALSPYGSVLEIKYDGIRLLTHIKTTGVWPWSRNGKSKRGSVPYIENELLQLPAGTWLDAEAVKFNPDGTQHWGGAQSVLGSSPGRRMDRSGIKLIVFDVLAWDGEDVRNLPFTNRRAIIDEKIIAGFSFDHIMAATQFPATDIAHEKIIEAGFEGSMVKNLTAKYLSGKRVKTSLKLKATDTTDVLITGFHPAKEGWIKDLGLIGSVTFKHINEVGEMVEGRCSGMTVPERRLLTENIEKLVGTVMEVSYMGKMPPKGTLRHPQFVRLRPDKSVTEV